MDEKTLRFLQELTVKIGVTGEQAWRILVHGTFVDGCLILGFALVLVVLMFLAFRFRESFDKYFDVGGAIEDCVVPLFLVIGAILVVTFVLVGVEHVALPEYVALHNILSRAK